MQYDFKWDPQKAKINIKKHKINFENATTVFKDPRAISLYDDSHSNVEERWITMGLSSNGTLLVVHHTFQEINSETVNIRIFSSRKATKKEQQLYKEQYYEKRI